MSTKIYNAWELPEECDPFAIAGELAERTAKAMLDKAWENAISMAVHNLDMDALVLNEYDTPNEHAAPVRNMLDPDSVPSVRTWFIRSPENGRVYCVGADWGAGYNVVQEFAKTHGWKDYHYQNQTDKPDDVSEEEWEERERHWDIMLPGLGVILRHGLQVAVTGKDIGILTGEFWWRIIPEEVVRKHTPSTESRVFRAMSSSITVHGVVADISDMVTIRREVGAGLNADSPPADVADAIATVKELLPEVTSEALTSRFAGDPEMHNKVFAAAQVVHDYGKRIVDSA